MLVDPRKRILRLVQTQVILFLKSGRNKSDPTYNDAEIKWWISRSTPNLLKKTSFQSRSMSDPPFSEIDFRNKMALVRTTLNSRYFHFADRISGSTNYISCWTWIASLFICVFSCTQTIPKSLWILEYNGSLSKRNCFGQ